jgi:hypothetical protein
MVHVTHSEITEFVLPAAVTANRNRFTDRLNSSEKEFLELETHLQ